MDNSEEIFNQIKILCSSVTQNTYNDRIEQGYKLLIKLHDLGLEKEMVYQLLIQYYNSLENNLFCDYIADIMDFVVGWCPLQKYLWKDNE